MKYYPVVIVGAGSTGLTAVYELAKKGIHSLVLEKSDKVGGISPIEVYRGYRFDIGWHRFYTKVAEVEQLWQEVLGDDVIQVPRLSRIYYQGKFFAYPLSLANTLSNLGIFASGLTVLNCARAKLKTIWERPEPETFDGSFHLDEVL